MFDIIIIRSGATGVSLLSHIQHEVCALQLKIPEIAVLAHYTPALPERLLAMRRLSAKLIRLPL